MSNLYGEIKFLKKMADELREDHTKTLRKLFEWMMDLDGVQEHLTNIPIQIEESWYNIT